MNALAAIVLGVVVVLLVVRHLLRCRGLFGANLAKKTAPAARNRSTKVEIIDVNRLIRKHRIERYALRLVPSLLVPALVLTITWFALPSSQALTWALTSVQGDNVTSANNPGGGVVNGLSQSPKNGNYFSPAFGGADSTVMINGTGFPTPTKIDAAEIKGGRGFVCYLSNTDGWLYCWGANDNGQLGDGTTTQRALPTPITHGQIPSSDTIKYFTLGDDHSCVITSSDGAYCWGSNLDGQMGVGSTGGSHYAPELVTQGDLPNGEYFKIIEAGGDVNSHKHTCAISNNDILYCWGANGYGQLGLGEYSYNNGNYSTPKRVKTTSDGGTTMPDTVKQVSAGEGATCAIAMDDVVYCWGAAGGGQLGNNSTYNSTNLSAAVFGITGSFVEIKTSGGTSCALQDNGDLYCWGHNEGGQLGTGTTSSSAVPVKVSGGIPFGHLGDFNFRSSAVGTGTICATSIDGVPYCWGNGTAIGDGTSVFGDIVTTPTKVKTVINGGTMPDIVQSMATIGTRGAYYNGDTGACAVTSDNVYCWGLNLNSWGTIGNNAYGPVAAPAEIVYFASMPHVWLDGVGSYECAKLTIPSTKQLKCMLPQSDISDGLHDVVVEYDSGTASLAAGYMTKNTLPQPTFTAIGKNNAIEYTASYPSDKPYFTGGSTYVVNCKKSSSSDFYFRDFRTYDCSTGEYTGVTNVVGSSYRPEYIIGLQNNTSYDLELSYIYRTAAGNTIFSQNVDVNAYARGITPQQSIYVPSAPTVTSLQNCGSTSSGDCGVTLSSTSDGGSVVKRYYWQLQSSGYNDWAQQTGGGSSVPSFWIPNSGITKYGSATLRFYAVNANGSSEPSQEIVIYGSSANKPPNVPENIRVNNVNTDQTMLSWGAPSDNGSAITSYEARYSTQSDFADWVDSSTNTCVSNSPSPPTPSCVTASLPLGTLYYFQVRALNANGAGDWSVIHGAIVGAPDRPVITAVTAANTTSSVTWSVPNNNGAAVTSFTLQRSTESTFASAGLIATLPLNSTWASANCTGVTNGDSCVYGDSGLTNGTTYYYRVLATNSRGAGPYSDPAAAIPYAPPTIIAVTPDRGIDAGNEVTVITGHNLNGATAVTIDGKACVTFVVVDASTINCLTPSGTSGAKDVSVTNLGGSDTKAGSYTYVLSYLTMTSDKATVSFGQTPTASGVFSSGSNTVTVKTNAHGFDLTLQAAVGNRNLSRLDSNPAVIGPVSGSFAGYKSTINPNQWGFTLNANSTASQSVWSAIPNLAGPVTIKSSNSANETGDQTIIYYGTLINLAIPSGTYHTSVIYTATAKF